MLGDNFENEILLLRGGVRKHRLQVLNSIEDTSSFKNEIPPGWGYSESTVNSP